MGQECRCAAAVAGPASCCCFLPNCQTRAGLALFCLLLAKACGLHPAHVWLQAAGQRVCGCLCALATPPTLTRSVDSRAAWFRDCRCCFVWPIPRPGCHTCVLVVKDREPSFDRGLPINRKSVGLQGSGLRKVSSSVMCGAREHNRLCCQCFASTHSILARVLASNHTTHATRSEIKICGAPRGHTSIHQPKLVPVYYWLHAASPLLTAKHHSPAHLTPRRALRLSATPPPHSR